MEEIKDSIEYLHNIPGNAPNRERNEPFRKKRHVFYNRNKKNVRMKG